MRFCRGRLRSEVTTYRVLALAAPAPHFIHAMKVVRRKGGATYEACSCGTRRIVIGPRAVNYDAAWLRSGVFADEAHRSATLFTLSSVQANGQSERLAA